MTEKTRGAAFGASTEQTGRGPAKGRARGSSPRVGPLGYGNGPVLTSGFMALGGVVAAGWGLANIAGHGGPDAFIEALKDRPAAQSAPVGQAGEDSAGGADGGEPQSPGPDGQTEVPSDPGTATQGSPGSPGSPLPHVPDGGAWVWVPGRDQAGGGGGGGASGDGGAGGAGGAGSSPGAPGTGGPGEGRLISYVIERGDTLSEISARTHVPLDALVETNHIANPNLIYAGASLLLLSPVG